MYFDPKNNIVNLLQDIELEVPSRVVLEQYQDEGDDQVNLVWNVVWEESNFKSVNIEKQRGSSCLSDFLELADLPIDKLCKKVESFVRKWGPLAMVDRQTPMPVSAVEKAIKKSPEDTAWCRTTSNDEDEEEFIPLPLWNLGAGCWYREPVSDYQRLARCIQGAIEWGTDQERIIRYLQDKGNTNLLSTWTDLMSNIWAGSERLKDMPERNPALNRSLNRFKTKLSKQERAKWVLMVNELINNHLNTHWFSSNGIPLQLSVKTDDKDNSIRLALTRSRAREIQRLERTNEMSHEEWGQWQINARSPSTARLLLSLQIVQAIKEGAGICRCAFCGDAFEPNKRRPRIGTTPLCAKKSCRDEQHKINERNSYQRRKLKADETQPAND